MSMVQKPLLALLCLGLLPCAAFADASARAYVAYAGTPPSQPPYVYGSIEAMSVGAPSVAGSAMAYANLNSGILRAVGSTNRGSSEASAVAAITDTATFTGGLGSIAYLDYLFDGSFDVQANPNLSAAFAQLGIQIATVAGSTTRYETLSANPANCGSASTNCVVGTSTARTGTIAFQIYGGSTSFSFNLNGYATEGNSFNFGNTARFALRLADGVSYTSGSGSFLLSAAPITPVPEVPAAWLLGSGLALLGGWRVRGRRWRSAPQLLG